MSKFNSGDHIEVIKNTDEPEYDYLIGSRGFIEDVLPKTNGTDYTLDGFPDVLFHESELKKIDSEFDVLERGVEKTRVFQAEYADA